MKADIFIKEGLVIPESELEFITSRSGGPGGQHVNKTESRITIYWDLKNSAVITQEQKDKIFQKLPNNINSEGFLHVSNSESRSQEHNRKRAIENLVRLIQKALYVPKKRMKTRVPTGAKEARLESKGKHSLIKKLRSKFDY